MILHGTMLRAADGLALVSAELPDGVEQPLQIRAAYGPAAIIVADPRPRTRLTLEQRRDIADTIAAACGELGDEALQDVLTLAAEWGKLSLSQSMPSKLRVM